MKTHLPTHLPTHPTLRHPLTGRPLVACGVLPSGRVVWPQMGASEPAPEPEPEPEPDPKPDDSYRPPPTQADLDRIIGDRVARERAKYSDYAELKRKAEAHDKALEEAQTEQEKAVAEARKQGEESVRQEANNRLVASEARALAAEAKFRNPALAVRTVDLSDVTVNESGEVDADAVRTKLKELADAEPYMIDDGKPTKPKPDPSQGPRPEDDKPSVSRGREMFESRRGKSSAAS